MNNTGTRGHSALTLTRLGENLSAALSDAKTAGSAGAAFIPQKPSGAVYTDRLGAWTFNLSSARGFQQGAAPILGARAVAFEGARGAIVTEIQDHLA